MRIVKVGWRSYTKEVVVLFFFFFFGRSSAAAALLLRRGVGTFAKYFRGCKGDACLAFAQKFPGGIGAGASWLLFRSLIAALAQQLFSLATQLLLVAGLLIICVFPLEVSLRSWL